MILAEDPRMIAVLDLVRQVAPTPMPVLICGESGTGKKLIARGIHEHSRDPSLPFLPVRAAAVPDALLEAEIFAKARGGTIFLDEIDLMSPACQSTLLRVLQGNTVVPRGSPEAKPAGLRLVTATNRSLRELTARGEFREDLYYRLRVVTIDVPPLRKRPDDVLPLARHFLSLHAAKAGFAPGHGPGLTPEACAALQRHRWPGNVRELEDGIRQALILSRGGDIRARHLSLDPQSGPPALEITPGFSYEEGKQQVVAAYQRRAAEGALRATRGNVSRAAEMCGLTRAAFQRILRSLDLDRRQFSGGK